MTRRSTLRALLHLLIIVAPTVLAVLLSLDRPTGNTVQIGSHLRPEYESTHLEWTILALVAPICIAARHSGLMALLAVLIATGGGYLVVDINSGRSGFGNPMYGMAYFVLIMVAVAHIIAAAAGRIFDRELRRTDNVVG